MTNKNKNSNSFVEGLSVADLFAYKEQPKTEPKTEPKPSDKYRMPAGWYDFTKEVVGEDGWVYEKLRRNKKGKKLRKMLMSFRTGYDESDISFWKPKLDDLALCEAKRWDAIQYKNNQYSKINGVFQRVLKNTPFCCIRMTEAAPGFDWVIFPHYEGHGVSWEWWEDNYKRRNKQELLERPDCQLRQDIGDEWFNFENRSRLILKRVSYFERLFFMALEKRYADEFYRERQSLFSKKKLIINGRDYLIGETNGRCFGVIAYPENTIVEVVEPGPIRSKNEWE